MANHAHTRWENVGPFNQQHQQHLLPGVALLANAPERMPERRKRGREKEKEKEKEAAAVENRHLPPLPTSGKLSSRGARQRIMAQREEQIAAQKVSAQHDLVIYHIIR